MVIPKLTLKSVDFCEKTNAKTHHTELFQLENDSDTAPVILRRAQPFTWILKFDKNLNMHYHKLYARLTPVNNQTTSTTILLPPSTHSTVVCNEQIAGRVDGYGGKTMIEMTFGSKSVIGEYMVDFATASVGETPSFERLSSRNVFVMYNPWSDCADEKRDVTSLGASKKPNESDEERIDRETDQKKAIKQYVDSAVCRWWNGDEENVWRLGQHDIAAFRFTKMILEQLNLDSADWKSEPKVVEQIAVELSKVLKLSKKHDFDNLERLDEENWTSSLAIIKYILQTDKVAKDGHSWMFSGLLITVLRVLGIGCRMVSAKNVGVDLNKNGVVEREYYRESPDGEFHRVLPDSELSGLPKDKLPKSVADMESPKSFHVWIHLNRRPDLDNLNIPRSLTTGWQAVDPTPSAMLLAYSTTTAVGPTVVNSILNAAFLGPHGSKLDLVNGKYWYTRLHGDILHKFMENHNGVVRVIGHYFERNRLASSIITENVDGGLKDIRNNYVPNTNTHRDDFYNSTNTTEEIRKLSEKGLNNEITLTERNTQRNVPLNIGDVIEFNVKMSSTKQNLQYRTQYLLVNPITKEPIASDFNNVWKDLIGTIRLDNMTRAAEYLRKLAGGRVLDAYLIVTIKNQPTTVYHKRFTFNGVEFKLTKQTTPPSLNKNIRTFTVTTTNNMTVALSDCDVELVVTQSTGVKIRKVPGDSCDFIRKGQPFTQKFSVEFPELKNDKNYQISAKLTIPSTGTVLFSDILQIVKIDGSNSDNSSDVSADSDTDETGTHGESDNRECKALDERKKKLNKMENELKKKENDLAERENNQNKREKALDNRENRLNHKDNKQNNKENILNKREKNINKRENRVKDKEDTLSDKDNKLNQKEIKLGDREDELVNMKKNLEYKERALVKLEIKLDYNKEKLIEREKKLTSNEEKHVKREEHLTYKEESLVKREENVTYKEEKLVKREENLTYKEESLVKREENVTYKEEKLVKREENLTNKEESLVKREENVTYKEEKFVKREVKLSHKEELQVDREKKLDYKKKEVRNREKNLEDKEENLNDRQRELVILDEMLANRNTKLENMKKELDKKRKELDTQQEQQDNKEQVLNDLQKKLDKQQKLQQCAMQNTQLSNPSICITDMTAVSKPVNNVCQTTALQPTHQQYHQLHDVVTTLPSLSQEYCAPLPQYQPDQCYTQVIPKGGQQLYLPQRRRRQTDYLAATGHRRRGDHSEGTYRNGHRYSTERGIRHRHTDQVVKKCWLTGMPRRHRSHHM